MANQLYDNFVLANKFDSLLATKVDLANYMTVDRELAEDAGMKKKINRYSATGNVEDLAMTQGNSGIIESTFKQEEYEVGVTQGKGVYYDEEAMRDPKVVDALVRGMAEIMANDFTTKAIEEFGKGTQKIECDYSTATAGYFFEKVVDAIAIFGEETDGLTLLISPKNQAYVRKQLRDDLKYSEGYVRTGYIGHVAGIPVVMSKAVPDSCSFIANKEAVTLFIKKDSEAEQERDADHRKNTLFLRKVALVALTNDTKLVCLGKAQTACAITTGTKATKTVGGTCDTGAYKVVFTVNGENPVEVTPSAGSWSGTASANLVANDKINAIAYKNGYANAVATEFTVEA